MTAELLIAEAVAIQTLGAAVLDAADIGTRAVEYAIRNWPVFPGNGKAPAIAGGRGVLDATTDLPTVIRWWAGKYAGCNICGRVPESMFVLDADPRHGGLDSLNQLHNKYGMLPHTLTTVSGRGDGGVHLFYRRPPGKLSAKRLGPGIDIKTSSGYVMLPPSTHPATGKPYVRIDRPVVAPPHWLTALLRPEPAQRTERRFTRPVRSLSGPSIADKYSQTASWAEILEPHGWRCLDADPDADGARWRHPTATSPSSATVRHGCLFVYSPNTPFDVTETSDAHGYTRFRAYAVLNHGGDLRAAHRALRERQATPA
ncbi:MAG: bifunctional DNA primase/polymerase [Trebonia sp.]